MNLFESSLPQIIQPKFPVPQVSDLSHKLSYAIRSVFNCKDGQNRVQRFYKTNYFGGVLAIRGQKVAVYIQSSSRNGREYERYLFITEPELTGEKISRTVLFDRFNAILVDLKLPTLHEVVKDYWIFSDGPLWNGRRTFRLPKEGRLSEKEVLQGLLTMHP